MQTCSRGTRLATRGPRAVAALLATSLGSVANLADIRHERFPFYRLVPLLHRFHPNE